uniref:Uncharacterized protein n=1 Tax=Vespula pensylvanica TaxID=30213 RepID=A0A834PFK3_VESPE|nr:hypothetical protein H0235_001185 [Vespula pensylvanica]
MIQNLTWTRILPSRNAILRLADNENKITKGLEMTLRRISLIAPLCKEKQAASATAAAAAAAAAAGARSTCNGRASHFGKFGERIACYSSIET